MPITAIPGKHLTQPFSGAGASISGAAAGPFGAVAVSIYSSSSSSLAFSESAGYSLCSSISNMVRIAPCGLGATLIGASPPLAAIARTIAPPLIPSVPKD